MSCVSRSFSAALSMSVRHGINEQMKMACVKALAAMAQEEVSAEVAMAYPGEELSFGPEYLIPKPFDPRLITTIAPAVARRR
jgi:malate dehydrogenase (oxaloacetate-decarboxylating)(NADP+)